MSETTARISWFAGELVSIDAYLNATPVVPTRRMAACTIRHVTPAGELREGTAYATTDTIQITPPAEQHGQYQLIYPGQAGYR